MIYSYDDTVKLDMDSISDANVILGYYLYFQGIVEQIMSFV